MSELITELVTAVVVEQPLALPGSAKKALSLTEFFIKTFSLKLPLIILDTKTIKSILLFYRILQNFTLI